MGNFLEQQIIYYFVCGEKIDNEMIDQIFKLKGKERIYEFKNPKVKWIAKIYQVGFDANNYKAICSDMEKIKKVKM